MSGPHSPQDPPNLLAAFAMRSGPTNPQDPHLRVAKAGAGAGGAGGDTEPTRDGKPEPKTSEKVTIRVAIRKPEPLAVAISSTDPMKIELQKIEIQIFRRRELVFSTLISEANDQTVDDARTPRLFPLNSEELKKLLPHMQVGNTAHIHVEYLAKSQGELHISVIGHHSAHSSEEILKEVVEAQP